MDNARKALLVDDVIVASPHYIPSQFNAHRYIGYEEDVLMRYYDCAKSFGLKDEDAIVRITSDCPFVNPEVVDTAIEMFYHLENPYLCFAPIDGMDVEVFTFKMLTEAHLKADDPYDREHVTPYMKRATKLSIDTYSDLKNARRYYGLQR